MPAETAADRASFFDTDDFGVEATYTPAGGDGVTINGILNEPSGRAFNDAIATTESPQFTCRTSDLPSGARGGEHSGDRLTIGQRVFRIAVIDPDGTGISSLELEELSE